MLKYLLSLFLLISFSYTLHAQSEKDTLIYYVKDNGNIVETKENADYILLILPKADGEKLYPVLALYPDGKPKMTGTSSTRSSALVLEGTQLTFFLNRKRRSVTTFQNGTPIGEQITYYSNGSIYTRKVFRKSQILLTECRDSLGVVLTENGNGEWIAFDDTFMNILAQGKVKDGLKEGEWYQNFAIVNYEKGIVSKEEAFTKRPFITREISPAEKDYLQTNNYVYYDIPDTLQNFIVENLNDNEKKDNAGMQIYIGFFVEKDGSLSTFKAFQSPSEELSNKLISLIKSTTPWQLPISKVPVILPVYIPVDILSTTLFKPIKKLDRRAQFPGGAIAYGDFLQKNIHYPKLERDAKIVGDVLISFFVEQNGSITDLHVLKTPSIGLSEEILRVMRLSPRWVAASSNKEPVRFQYTGPVPFGLPDVIPRKLPGLDDAHPSFITLPSGDVYVKVDVAPEFPGGLKQFRKFLKSKTRYPEIDKKNNVTGAVLISFIVETDGSMSNIKSLRSPSKTLTEEAIRVLKLCPNWRPALVKGKPVRTLFTAPFNFGLSEEPSWDINN